MFATVGHAALNTWMLNENDHDADAVSLKDFPVIAMSAKSMTALPSSVKTFGPQSLNAGKPFVEVGG